MYDNYGQRRPICKPCRRVYDREYHKKKTKEQKAHKLKLARELIEKTQLAIIDYLNNNPCVSCGESRLPCLQFDHIDPNTKVDNIANLVRSSSFNSIMIEISKCRVLCANCHAVRTAEQKNYYKYRLLNN